MSTAIWVVVSLMLAVVGYAAGRAAGRGAGRDDARAEGLSEGKEAGLREAGVEHERRLGTLAEAVARGRLPEGASPGSPEAELRRALEAGWAPREEERQRALREAVSRVSGFLDKAVRAPLAGAGDASDAGEIRERVERALGSLEDLEFFLVEPGRDVESQDLPKLVQQVTREFASDQGVGVRLRMDGRPVRANVNGRAFMDAIYLILHNATRFGVTATVDVTVAEDGGRAVVKVRDRGPGFTEEAFQRAFDPFYSTAEDGLGLGLPHARRTIEGMGGRIELRNVPDGGAEVELSFPSP
jgi:signal transduction histidine kinase